MRKYKICKLNGTNSASYLNSGIEEGLTLCMRIDHSMVLKTHHHLSVDDDHFS